MSTCSVVRPGSEAEPNTDGRFVQVMGRAADFLLAWEPSWVIPLLPLVFIQTSYSWAALLGAIFPWILRLARRGYLTRRTAFDPVVALLLAGVIVGSLASADHRLASEGLQSYLGGVLAFYLLVNHPRHLRLFLVCLFLAALAGTVWVFSQGSLGLNKTTAFNEWVYTLAAPLPKVTNQPAYPNGLAGLLVVAAPVAWGIAIYSARKRQRLIVGGLALLLSVAMVFTGSRGGLISLSVALVFVAAWRTRWGLLGLALVTGTALLMSLGRLSQLDHLWSNSWSSTAGGRWEIWRSTLEYVPGHLLTGAGPGASVVVYPHYVPPWLVSYATNPHNALLQLWSDAGLLGVVAALWATVAGLRLGASLLRLPRGHAHFGLAVGLLGAVIGAAVQGTFESAISGIIVDGSQVYHYVVSPLPWALAGFLWVVLSPFRAESEREKKVIGEGSEADRNPGTFSAFSIQ